MLHYNATLPERVAEEYYKMPFAPEAVFGLLIQSYLSSFPIRRFRTDGTSLYIEDGEPQTFSKGNSTAERDAALEDVIVTIIEANPPDLNVYNGVDGNFAFVGFQYGFMGLDTNSAYSKDMQSLRESFRTSIDAERKQVTRRLKKYQEQIQQIMTVAK